MDTAVVPALETPSAGCTSPAQHGAGSRAEDRHPLLLDGCQRTIVSDHDGLARLLPSAPCQLCLPVAGPHAHCDKLIDARNPVLTVEYVKCAVGEMHSASHFSRLPMRWPTARLTTYGLGMKSRVRSLPVDRGLSGSSSTAPQVSEWHSLTAG